MRRKKRRDGTKEGPRRGAKSKTHSGLGGAQFGKDLGQKGVMCLVRQRKGAKNNHEKVKKRQKKKVPWFRREEQKPSHETDRG